MNLKNIEDNIEKIAAAVHDAWWTEKATQGFHAPKDCPGMPDCGCDKCHADMIPYSDLAENIKDYDRVTVRTVIDAIKSIEVG